MTQFAAERDIRGSAIARCTCDDCSAQIAVKCNFVTREKDRRPLEVNKSQALVRLTDAGWTYIKNVLRCPKCESARKEKNMSKEPTVVNITPPPVSPIRQPTRDQKRLIVAALEEAYDTKNQRYKGKETDKGIAEMLGDGTMPGWVSAVREDMFGPDGNEEMTSLSGEIADWMKSVDDSIDMITSILAGIENHRSEVKKYQDRLNKIVAAIGPKAEKVA